MGAIKTAYLRSQAAGGRRPRFLVSDTTIVGTGANTTETAVYSYTLPDGALPAVGSRLRVVARGNAASSGAGTKNIRLKFGAAVVLLGSSLTTAYGWRVEAEIVRTAAGQTVFGQTAWTTSNNTPAPVLATEDLSAVDIVLTLQNATANANELTVSSVMVEIL
jgi:hypothetical protein